MTDQRTRLSDAIADAPGIHFNALVRRLDLAPGQVQYHVRKLLRDGAVLEEHLYGRTHYYPTDYTDFQRGAIALLRRETARDVVLYLLHHGPTDPATVTDSLDIARSTLEWHLDRLVERDLVDKRRDEDDGVTLALSRPAETVGLLTDVEPMLSERMVDRFTRLVDRLLAE